MTSLSTDDAFTLYTTLPQNVIKNKLLCCQFWCQIFGDVSLYVFSYHFRSVWLAFGKVLLTRLTIWSPCI